MDGTIERNLHAVRLRAAEAARAAGRAPGDVTLLAVSKTFPAAAVARAASAGQSDFGENRVQEAEGKIAALAGHPGLRWHLVGHLQANKARRAAELFDLVHSVDSVRIAERLNRHCLDLGKRLEVLVQVDLGGEAAKFGADPGRVRDIVEALSTHEALRLQGLMTIPPYCEDPERARPFFAGLRAIRDALEAEQPGCLGLRHLSMGMSHDFEVAIREGATIVRVGTSIFGSRRYD